jgi:hypothetical protein
MSADKCPICGANLRQYGVTVICEQECGFFVSDVTGLDKAIELWNKEHKVKV